MEHSHPPQKAVQSMAAEPDPNYNPSRMRKLGQNAARLARKMASTPTGSSSPATTNTAPTGETPDDHLQAALPPGCALPPGLPPPPGLSKPPEVPPPGLHPPPGFTPVVPREKAFGSRRSPPSRRPGGTHLENCHSLSKTRVYDNTLRCDKCGGASDFGWFYRCCHDTETRLYESIRDGSTEHFDEIGEMFSHQLKRPDRGPAARSDKLSLLQELRPEQIDSLSAPQLAKLLQQREHVNEQAITDRWGFLGLAAYDRPFLKSEVQECKQTLCPACGRGMMGEEVSFLDLDGVLKGDIPPTAAVGFGFRKHGRPIADANIMRTIGLRKATENKDQVAHPVQSEGSKAEEHVEPNVKDEDETSLATFTDAPLTPSNTFLNMADSSEDLLELYTDGSSVEVSQDNTTAQDAAPGEKQVASPCPQMAARECGPHDVPVTAPPSLSRPGCLSSLKQRPSVTDSDPGSAIPSASKQGGAVSIFCVSKQNGAMASDRTPLLADPRRSVDSAQSDRRAEEEDSLVRGSSPDRQPWAYRIREVVLFVWALLATAIIIVLAVWFQHNQQTGQFSKPPGKRNLIFMVSDGMGPASLSLTRSYRQLVEGLDYDDTLTLDKHFWGTSRTRSSNKLVTDSAAGATAFSCGKKSYNGAISMLPDSSPCGSVLEAAKKDGYHTGLVVTTDITDATPACFASHVDVREKENEIALQEIGEGALGRVVDLMLGGGRCHFLPNSTDGSCRLDDVDVAGIAQKKHGWTYFDDRAGFDSLQVGENASLPVLGLFASTDVPFEIDRKNMADIYPSLSEMATTALKALTKATENSDKGFFLMIEGSRIDHAAHINDPASHVREVLEYDKTFKIVLDFLENSKTEGLLVATSDHETGGLATAWQSPTAELPVYNWYPTVLAKANASAQYLAHKLHEHINSIKSEPAALENLEDWINTKLVIPGLGIADARDFELKELASDPEHAIFTFSRMISQRARIGWSTHGHSAVDVNIYSSGGRLAEDLHGNVENTQVGRFLRNYLDVDTDKITEQLREKMEWGQSLAVSTDDEMVRMGYEAEKPQMEWID